jgi:hypothetical protein
MGVRLSYLLLKTLTVQSLQKRDAETKVLHYCQVLHSYGESNKLYAIRQLQSMSFKGIPRYLFEHSQLPQILTLKKKVRKLLLFPPSDGESMQNTPVLSGPWSKLLAHPGT